MKIIGREDEKYVRFETVKMRDKSETWRYKGFNLADWGLLERLNIRFEAENKKRWILVSRSKPTWAISIFFKNHLVRASPGSYFTELISPRIFLNLIATIASNLPLVFSCGFLYKLSNLSKITCFSRVQSTGDIRD